MANTPLGLSYRLDSIIVWIPLLAGLYGCHSPTARTSARHASSNEQVGSDARTDPVAAGTAGTIPMVSPTRVDENHDIGVDASPPSWPSSRCGSKARIRQPALAIGQPSKRPAIRDGIALEQPAKDTFDGWQSDQQPTRDCRVGGTTATSATISDSRRATTGRGISPPQRLSRPGRRSSGARVPARRPGVQRLTAEPPLRARRRRRIRARHRQASMMATAPSSAAVGPT